MRKIYLTGKEKDTCVLVDDADFELLNQWKWHKNFAGYIVGRETGKNHQTRRWIRLHRLILNTPIGMETDHINGNKLDNRRENLRICTSSQNKLNRKIKSFSSYFKGITWNKKHKMWYVQISFEKKHFHIGVFKNEIHAAMAYDLWAKELHGDYAKLNFKSI